MLWYLGQKIFEITIRVQIVCLGRFCNAVTYSTCFGARNGVYQMPVAFPDYEASYGLFSAVVVQRDFSVFEEPAQIFLLVDAVGDPITGLAFGRYFPLLCPDPREILIHQWADVQVSHSLTVFGGKACVAVVKFIDGRDPCQRMKSNRAFSRFFVFDRLDRV